MILALEMTNPFLPLLIQSQTDANMHSAVFYNTLSLVLPMIANILLSPFWGLVADRYGYKAMLLRASWALVIIQTSMIFVSSVTEILLIRILQGAFAGFIVAMQTYALSLSTWQSKSRQLARLQTSKALGTATAGIIGGLALTLTNYQGLYELSSLLCLLITLIMHHQLPSSSPSVKKDNAVKIKKRFEKKNYFFFLCLLITITQIAKFLPDPGLSLYLNQFFPNQLIMIGLLYSLPAIGMLCSSEWCGSEFDKCRASPALVNRYLIRYGFLGLMLMLLQAYATSFYLFACIRIAWGIVLSALLPALFALCSDRLVLPGYALGLANSAAKLGNLLGIVLGGLLTSYLPYSTLFLIIAIIYALFIIFVIAHHLIYIRQSTLFSHIPHEVKL